MKIVIIGNGMVGYKFCEKLVTKSNGKPIEIVVFGEEQRPAYDRVHLSEYFQGKSAEDLAMAPLDWYEDHHIILHLGDPIQLIDRQNQVSILSKESGSRTISWLWQPVQRHLFLPYRVLKKTAYLFTVLLKTWK